MHKHMMVALAAVTLWGGAAYGQAVPGAARAAPPAPSWSRCRWSPPRPPPTSRRPAGRVPWRGAPAAPRHAAQRAPARKAAQENRAL